jgi:hypothetical protein
MVSNWEDYIVATRTKRGEFSVYGRKWAEEYSRGRYKKRWFTISSKKGIRTPAGIVSAIKDCEVELSVEVSWLEVVAKIEKLDPNIAREVGNLIGR